MKLVIFDIDGTLTATSKVDADCYVEAIRETFSITVDGSDWSRFRNYTDSGIFAEVFERAHGRIPTVEEDKAVQEVFIRFLKEGHRTNASDFSEIPGAKIAFQQLLNDDSWRIAMATGCWRSSAELKLEYAAIPYNSVPLATSDTFHRREDIMQDAHARARNAYHIDTFQRIVYVGDGIWDVRGSRNLGYHFVGIQHEKRYQELESEGAQVVLPNYLDMRAFMHALESAEVPA